MIRTKLWLGVIAIVACVALAQLVPVGAVAKRRTLAAVAPNDPPLGVLMDTLGFSGEITIGGTSFGGGSDTQLAYVVLVRTTREPVPDESGNVPGDDRGIAKLKDIATKYSKGSNHLKYLMIVSGRRSPPMPPGTPSAHDFFSLLKMLGAEVVTPAEAHSIVIEHAPFSIIGIPGAPAGAATVRIPGRLDPPLSGAIYGLLQKNHATKIDGLPVYDYVSGEYPVFDTRAADSTSTKNEMTVGDHRYEAGLTDVPGATAGLHIVIVDSLSLRPLVNHALVTNSTNPSYSDRQLQAGAATHLKKWLDHPSGEAGPAQPDVTVFVQTIGKPKAAGPEWGAVVAQLLRLRANLQYLWALNGTTEYALVSRLDSSLPPAEASTAADLGTSPTSPPLRLAGVLARTRMSTFEPIVESTPTSPNPFSTVAVSLIKVAYRQPEPWPKLAPEEKDRAKAAAAADYICKKLDFCLTNPDGSPAQNSCPNIRVCYWEKITDNWDTNHAQIIAMHYPGEREGFSEKTFNAVKDELEKETAAVAKVTFYLKQLQEPFTFSATKSYFNLQVIGKTVLDSVNPPRASSSKASTLELISKILSGGKVVGGAVGSGASGLSALFGLVAFFSRDNGQPIMGGEITAEASQLATQLFERVEAARRELEAIGQLLVSDYGKLMEAKRHIASDWSPPAPSDTADELNSATSVWFWEALIPVAYPNLIRGNALNARQLNCQTTPKQAWPNEPDSAQVQATIGYDNNGNPIKGIYFFTRGIFGASSPTGKLGEDMFNSPLDTPAGLGIEKLSFFTPSVFGGQIAHAVNNTSYCQLGWLPQLP